MARTTDASCKKCRREGMKLFLKGKKCTTAKCTFERRGYPPGQHGRGRIKQSNYGLQLREKQKVKRIYGILEKQFRRYFQNAEKSKGITGEVLLQILERRLDNVVFRACFASSRKEARQIVKHGHILVNGRKVDLPSYGADEGDVVKVKEKDNIARKIKDNIKELEEREIPDWLEVNAQALEIKIKKLPKREDIQLPISEQLIVELYSK